MAKRYHPNDMRHGRPDAGYASRGYPGGYAAAHTAQPPHLRVVAPPFNRQFHGQGQHSNPHSQPSTPPHHHLYRDEWGAHPTPQQHRNRPADSHQQHQQQHQQHPDLPRFFEVRPPPPSRHAHDRDRGWGGPSHPSHNRIDAAHRQLPNHREETADLRRASTKRMDTDGRREARDGRTDRHATSTGRSLSSSASTSTSASDRPPRANTDARHGDESSRRDAHGARPGAESVESGGAAVPMSSELLDPHTETKMMLSRKRRQLLSTEICGELPSPKTLPLSQILKNQAYSTNRARRKKKDAGDRPAAKEDGAAAAQKGAGGAAKKLKQKAEEEEEEQAYAGSDLFLKGTKSGNKHRDLLQYFVSTGQRPQNFVLNVGAEDKWLGYPDRQKLVELKAEVVRLRATPPMHIKCDLKTFDLQSFGTKFDVIHIDPPLAEYQARAPGVKLQSPPWTWEDVRKLDLGAIAEKISFVFMWCGSGEGLQKGRECFLKWGFKRCEDIVWVKSNRRKPGTARSTWDDAPLQHTTEHCLMGLRGRPVRKTDGHFVHANIDTDVIIADEPEEYGSNRKPDDIYELIENFCLGRRRLNIFGNDQSIRPGWISVGPDLTSSLYDKEQYLQELTGKAPDQLGGEPNALLDKRWANPETQLQFTLDNRLVGTTPEIEKLRPRSPPPHIANLPKKYSSRGGGGSSRGGGAGSRGRGRGRW